MHRRNPLCGAARGEFTLVEGALEAGFEDVEGRCEGCGGHAACAAGDEVGPCFALCFGRGGCGCDGGGGWVGGRVDLAEFARLGAGGGEGGCHRGGGEGGAHLGEGGGLGPGVLVGGCCSFSGKSVVDYLSSARMQF